MKIRFSVILFVIICLVYSVSACGGFFGKNMPTATIEISVTAITPTISNTPLAIDTYLPENTPTPLLENNPEPTSSQSTTGDTPDSTSAGVSSTQGQGNSTAQGSSQDSYPPPNVDPLTPGDGQDAYPPPFGDNPSLDNVLDPYPQFSEPVPIPPIDSNPYPPQSDLSATQPVAINPIQTPMITTTAPLSGVLQATSTSIVRTTLRASNPAEVVLVSGNYQMIEFFAFWSPDCKSLAPIMNGLEFKYKNRLSFVYLDIDDPANAIYKITLGYKYQPHIFLLDGDGKILHQWIGFNPVEVFEAELSPLFP